MKESCRKQIAELTSALKQAEKQKLELLAGFKKQMQLIDVLKKQKVSDFVKQGMRWMYDIAGAFGGAQSRGNAGEWVFENFGLENLIVIGKVRLVKVGRVGN